MSEYIAREALKNDIAASTEPFNTGSVFRMIDRQPAADVVPVVHGKWISFLDGDHIMPERYYRCSRCGRVESRRQPYCHCGAKMDGGDNTER